MRGHRGNTLPFQINCKVSEQTIMVVEFVRLLRGKSHGQFLRQAVEDYIDGPWLDTPEGKAFLSWKAAAGGQGRISMQRWIADRHMNTPIEGALE